MDMKTLNAITKIILFILCSFELWLRDFVAQRLRSRDCERWISIENSGDAQFPCIVLLSGTITYVSIWSLRSAAGTDQLNGLGH